jgi:TIR domain-containing protein
MESKTVPVLRRDVFVSHSTKDKEAADAIVAHLESGGVSCWIAPRDIVPGADWGASVLDAIEAARIMVLIFSHNANSSSQIKREVERAVNKDTYIIPFRLDDTAPTKSLEYFISSSQWMDAFPPPLDRHLGRLVTTITAVMANTPEASETKEEEKRKEEPREKGAERNKVPDVFHSSEEERRPAPPELPQVLLGVPTYYHQVPMPSAQGPSIGMRIAVPVSVLHGKGKSLQLVTKCSYANGPFLWANAQEPLFRDLGGVIATGTQPRLLPSDNEPFREESVMIPYYALNFPATNGFNLYNLSFVVFAYLNNEQAAQTMPVFFQFRW